MRILATSREALKIPGEIARTVPPLTLPDVQVMSDAATLRTNEAVKLFIDRAESVLPAFTLTATNARAVVNICRQLDGIPLAIELAAVRTSALTVEQIAVRLNDRFRLLTGGGRAPQPRHRALRAALDWSYDLLSAPEQALLRRLSIFPGGHTLEAAEYVCEGDPIASAEVLAVLTRLVDKSLVLADVTSRDEARYRMLETIRQYAMEELEAAGEYARCCIRRRDWFLALTERAEPALRGSHQERWLERLSLELDNLRAVMEWCRSAVGDSEIGLRIAGALGMFWDVRGFWREGLQWIEDFLAKAGHAPGSVRARALNWAATLAYRQGDYARVRTMSAQAFELGRAAGDRWNSALALHYLGHVAQVDGDFDAAATRLSESVDLFRADGDQWGLAYSLNCLADVARNRGALDDARVLFEEAVGIWRAIRNTWGLALSLHNLGHVVLRRGDYQKAGEMFAESLLHMQALGSKFMAYNIAALAAAAAGAGKYQQAARLFGSADTMLKQVGLSLEPADRADFDRNLAKVRAGLHEEVFSDAWRVGLAMPIDEVLEYALGAFRSPVVQAAVKAARRGPLTSREQEVAALVARGLSNREIANALIIAQRTAETHVQNIMNKLGFNSRAQIAAWAVEHGLHSISR